MRNKLAKRFRGFLPVVLDVETGGLKSETDALLEIAIVLLGMNDAGQLFPRTTHFCHIVPFNGARLDPAALAINQIDPYHPFRFAVSEREALTEIFQHIEAALVAEQCERAVLVGHNANFDLSFIQAAAKRCHIRELPFHSFTTFDTAGLAGVALGETVLARAARTAGIAFDREKAHSAIYDAERTAELFCYIVNHWRLDRSN
ncbi:MAG: ribonuclease T [Gammaproteobacteria bacterium]